MQEPFHVTHNLKFAAALATCGAEVLDSDKIKREGRETLVFTLGEKGRGITARYAAKLWDGKGDTALDALADSIIERRGITPDEYAVLQLECCRAVLNNRGVLLKCGMLKKPIVAKTLKSGRQVTYREGTSKEELRRLLA